MNIKSAHPNAGNDPLGSAEFAPATAAAAAAHPRLKPVSTRLATTAAADAMTGASVRLAFFLARKPTTTVSQRRYARFRA